MLTEYIAHFGLRETPFGRNQNPKWLYLSTQHKEAVLKTRWAIEENSGLVLWRGDVGQGKSSLIEYLMTVWPKQFGWKCAKLQNTGTISGPHTFLTEVISAFGIMPEKTSRKMTNQLETWLLNESLDGGKVVLFIDEAQTIGSKAFPVIRDLLNLQTRNGLLMQIVLAGQLNIDKRLKSFPALRSRIASVTTMTNFSYDECDAMLLHRLELAGAFDPFKIFGPETIQAVYHHSEGAPRDFVTIAEASMKEAFLRDSPRVEVEHVEQAVLSLAGRSDYIPVFGSERIPTREPVKQIHRAAVKTLQEMKHLARAG